MEDEQMNTGCVICNPCGKNKGFLSFCVFVQGVFILVR